MIFRDYLQGLNSSFNSLQSHYKRKDLNTPQKIIVKVHLDSYNEAYKYISNTFRDQYYFLLKRFDLNSKEDYTSELVDTLERYINSDKLNLFHQFEVKVVEMKYLNERRNSWITKEHKSLIHFFLYCRSRGLIRRPFNIVNDNSVLKELQKRYNRNIGTMEKYSKWKKYNIDPAVSEFTLLDKIK